MKLKGKARELDRLHLEYETLLVREIESLVGIASIHGWKSHLYGVGLTARNRLRKAGSEIAPESK